MQVLNIAQSARKRRRYTTKTNPDQETRVADFADVFQRAAQVRPGDYDNQSDSYPMPSFTKMKHELDIDLPAHKALGHVMYVAGIRPQQFVWCQRCCAYSGQRVQLLDKPCKGNRPRSQPFTRLDSSKHPITCTPLATQKRRMTVRDIGLTHGWDLSGSPEDTRNLYAVAAGIKHSTCSDTANSAVDTLLYEGTYDNPDPSTVGTFASRAYAIASDDDVDPFEHGFELD